MRTFLIAFFLGCFFTAEAQLKTRVHDFLYDTAGRENTLYYAQLGYNIPVLTNYNTAGYGFQFSFGPNLAYPFSRKLSAGVFVGVKWTELLQFIGKYDSDFSADMNASLQPGNGYAHDSVLVSYFAEQTGVRGQGAGASFLQLGIYASWPKRYLPLVKIYRAQVTEGVEAYMYDGTYVRDFLYVTSNRAYGASASWTVFRVKNSSRINISSWFTWHKFQSMNLQGVWLHEFVNSAFNEKYRNVWRAGITVGVEFY